MEVDFPGVLAAGVHILHAFAVAPQETTEREFPAPLVQTAAIALPDVEGRIDHLTADVARERLYVAALGNDSVEVVDLAPGRQARSA